MRDGEGKPPDKRRASLPSQSPSVTDSPLCRLRDIFPRPGEVFPQRESQKRDRQAIASPFGSNNDDRRQWRKQGIIVGAVASKTQVLFKHEADAGCRNPGSGTPQA